MNNKPVHLLIVDDHKLFRKALASLISAFGFQVTFYEAANGLEGIKIIAANKIDLVLLDMQMPVMNGMETMRKIAESSSRPYVIVLTQFDEQALITYMWKHGANGFLSKGCDPEELREAMLGVLKEGYFYNDMARKVNILQIGHPPNLELSARELQVMELLKGGKSNKEISKTLKLSLRTIESYRKTLMKKTQCRNVADVVSLAWRTGIGAK